MEYMSAAVIASAWLPRVSPLTNSMIDNSENSVAKRMVRWTR